MVERVRIVGGLDLGDNFGRLHLLQCLGGAEIAVAGDVFVDDLRIDLPLVAHDPEKLVREERDRQHVRNGLLGCGFHVEQFLHRPALEKMLLHQKRNDLRGQFLVEDALGLNQHHRPHRTKSVAAGLDDLDLLRQPAPLEFLLDGRLNLKPGTCLATGAAAQHQLGSYLAHASLLKDAALVESYLEFAIRRYNLVSLATN